MEEILYLYAQPYDPARPVVCFDERPFQMISEVRSPIPCKPGQPVRFDYEYQRNGTCNLFILFQPLAGWRNVEVTEQRTKIDFAQQMKKLVDEHFPEAEVIRVVLDNLNTHSPTALYEAFKPEDARRILNKLEFHYTPKHGSWLNMAEIEISVLSQQCLGRRIPNTIILEEEIATWKKVRNTHKATVKWRFTLTDARTKLRRLYPP